MQFILVMKLAWITRSTFFGGDVTHSVCGRYSSEDLCPTDGPSYDATVPGEGTHRRSNNALWSCFAADKSVRP